MIGEYRPYDGPWLNDWISLGRKNPWIKHALNDPFDFDTHLNKKDIHKCLDANELLAIFEHGNWCLGAAFCLGEVCFINQINGGDEWLTICRNVAFESITAKRCFKNVEELKTFITDVMASTDEQLRHLDYDGQAELQRRNENE